MVELVVDRHDPVVQLELVGERRVEPCIERVPGDVVGQPGVPGTHTLSIGSHSSVGPQFLSPGRCTAAEVLEEEVGVVLVGEDDARLDPALDGLSRMWSSAPKKLLRCSSGAAIRADDIIGACEAQYARTISATGLPLFAVRTARGSSGSRPGRSRPRGRSG